MRMLRVRFTVRRMLVAVAIVGLTLGLIHAADMRLRERSARFQGAADHHVAWLAQRGWKGSINNCLWEPSDTNRQPNGAVIPSEQITLQHMELAAKYTYVAHASWWPVAPDPPEPQ